MSFPLKLVRHTANPIKGQKGCVISIIYSLLAFFAKSNEFRPFEFFYSRIKFFIDDFEAFPLKSNL